MWYIARTKPRFEKKAEMLLNAITFEGVASPLVADALVLKVRRKWSDRMKEVEIPSISGYLFIRFAPELSDNAKAQLLIKIHYTPGILHLLTHPGESPFSLQGLAGVSDTELQIFREAAQVSGNSIVPAEADEPQIKVGSLVRIIKGPLQYLNVTFLVDDMRKEPPILYINDGIFRNAHFSVPKEYLELVDETSDSQK